MRIVNRRRSHTDARLGTSSRPGDRQFRKQARGATSLQTWYVEILFLVLVSLEGGKPDHSVGIIKTHRLPLHNATSTHVFDSPNNPVQSRLSIGPKALKDMMEHFPSVKGNKGDPQLIWSFGDSEVQIKSLETSIDMKGAHGEIY
jgi:hypothetical protein